MKPNDKPCMDVWENNTKVPKLHSYIVATNSVGDTIYGKANVHSGNQFYIMENSNFHIKKWCYIDDLLQSHNELQAKVSELTEKLQGYELVNLCLSKRESLTEQYVGSMDKAVDEICELETKVAMLEEALTIADEYLNEIRDSEKYNQETCELVHNCIEKIAEITKTKDSDNE